jgi:hypothetical protein
MDRGTQGRVERIFLHAHALVLCSPRQKTNRRRQFKISKEYFLQVLMDQFHFGASFQADARDRPNHFAPAGFLAAQAIHDSRFTIHDCAG